MAIIQKTAVKEHENGADGQRQARLLPNNFKQLLTPI